MRILVAGFQHETNTFAPSRAGYQNFVNGEGFPAMRRGNALFELEDVNIPVGGFLKAIRTTGHTVVPVIWAGACPSAHVTRDAYERIAGEIHEAARRERAEAVFLDLHGAMVAEHLDDGEGVLVARLREIVGPEVPIVVSLDLHANVTHRMLSTATAMVAYRTYPHVDMAATGARAAELLRRIELGERLHCLWRRIPFLIPINAGSTCLEPAGSVYRRLGELEGTSLSLSFAAGFPAADFPECGPMVWGHGSDRDRLDRAVDELTAEIVGREAEWLVQLLEPEAAVREAIRLAAGAVRPVVIADTQDNPGAGGDSNTTGMLKALVRCGVQGAALGLLCDADAARAAHEAGEGNEVRLALGGSGTPGDTPFEATFMVERLSPGRCRFDGPMMHGNELDLGPAACLRIGGVRVAVTTRKSQMLDRNLFRMVGIEPEAATVLVVKSSVHFRADFQPIAEAILVARAPGPMAGDPADLPWKRIAQGIRLRPLGPAFSGLSTQEPH